MEDKKYRLAILTDILPKYRLDFFNKIYRSDKVEFTIYCQGKFKDSSLLSYHSRFEGKLKVVKSFSFRKESLVIQSLPIYEIISEYDAYLIYGNPRFISHFFLATILRIMGKKVAIWGQAHTAGANKFTEKIRLFWWKRFKYFFVYTEKECETLKLQGFSDKNLIPMNNGLDQKKIDLAKTMWPEARLSKWQKKQGIENKKVLISCARLIPKNEFELMISALKIIKIVFPDILWVVIGSGEQQCELFGLSKDYGVEENIYWLGAIYDEFELAPWFLSSLVFIHPGAVGLSLLHSFGYGIPAIVHNSSKDQMPEYAAFSNCKNGLTFSKGDPKDLAKKIELVLRNTKMRSVMASNALDTVKKEYNLDRMVNEFHKLSTLLLKPS